jgi:hypothetical protein
MFILQVLFIAWYQGLLSRDTVRPTPPPTDLVMTSVEAMLTRQAIELIREEVVSGTLQTTDLTLRALYAELPRSVRERVLTVLGEPDMDYMRDALDVLDGKIIERN